MPLRLHRRILLLLCLPLVALPACGPERGPVGPTAETLDFAGTWDLIATAPDGTTELLTLSIEQHGARLEALVGDDAAQLRISGPTATGHLTDGSLEIRLLLEGDHLAGSLGDPSGGTASVISFQGSRRGAIGPGWRGNWALRWTTTSSDCPGAVIGKVEEFCISVSVENNVVALDDGTGDGLLIGTLDQGVASLSRGGEDPLTFTAQLGTGGVLLSGSVTKGQDCTTSISVAGVKVEYCVGDDPIVFDDDYGNGVAYFPFVDGEAPVTIDPEESYAGSASLRVEVPASGSPPPFYAGGAMVAEVPRDISSYTALTFWVKADRDVRVAVMGFGNDINRSGWGLLAERGEIEVSSTWQKVIVPMPDPSQTTAESGLFHFAADGDDGGGYTLWLDEIRFEDLGGIQIVESLLPSFDRVDLVGTSFQIGGVLTIFQRDSELLAVGHSPDYFDYQVSNPSVLTVAGEGQIHVEGAGQATVEASLRGIGATDQIVVTAYDPPATAAPTPDHPASDVISLFSDAYDDVPVDSWRTSWSFAEYSEFPVQGNDTKLYAAFEFVGIEFRNPTVDASEMQFLHLDVYTPVGSEFGIELVSFPGVDGFVSQKLTLDSSTTPAFRPGEWSSLEIPLDSLQWPAEFDWSRIGQIVLSGNASLVLLDNLYFRRATPPDPGWSGFWFFTTEIVVDTCELGTGAGCLEFAQDGNSLIIDGNVTGAYTIDGNTATYSSTEISDGVTTLDMSTLVLDGDSFSGTWIYEISGSAADCASEIAIQGVRIPGPCPTGEPGWPPVPRGPRGD